MYSRQISLFLVLCLISLSSCAAYKYIPTDFKLYYNPVLRNKLSYEDFIYHAIDKLFDVGQSALAAHSKFQNYVDEQIGKALAKAAETLNKLKLQVSDAIDTATNSIAGAQNVKACLAEKKAEADELFSNAVTKGRECIENRRQKARDLFNSVNNITANAQQYASVSKEDAKKCTETKNFLKIGVCLAKLSAKITKFVAKSKYWLARINLHMLMLPASLGFCAGTGLANIGTNTARVVFEIGLCTSSKVHDYLTGYPVPSDNNQATYVVPSTVNHLDGNTVLPSNHSFFFLEDNLFESVKSEI